MIRIRLKGKQSPPKIGSNKRNLKSKLVRLQHKSKVKIAKHVPK